MLQPFTLLTYSLSLCIMLLFSQCNSKSINFDTLSLTDVEGNTVYFNQFADKPQFINFWATWCPPCRKENPSIAAAYRQLGKSHHFIMISDEPIETLQAYKQQMNYPMTFLHTNTPIKSRGIFSIPQTYLRTTTGEIHYTHTGDADWSSPEMVSLIKELY